MRFSRIFLILSIFMFLSGCNNHSDKNYKEPDQEIYSPQYAKGFEIGGFEDDNNSVLTIKNPWQGAENVVSRIYISNDGTFPENFEGSVIKGSPQRIVCMSSTHIALLDALGETDRIVGVSGIGFISNPKIQSKKNEIADVGYDGNIDYEKLASVNPDLVLLYSINGASDMEGKLKELGIPFIYLGEYVEALPLGKAEWIVAMAEILNKREEGLKSFKEIENRYSSIKKRLEQALEPSPKVMLNMPYGDAWYMPSSNSYIANLLKDAGAEYLYKRNTGNASLPVERETAYKMAREADFWINFGSISNLEELRGALPKFIDIINQKEGKLYNDNKRHTPSGGNDSYESGIINPDLLLRDLIKIFHPSLVEEEFVYYHPLK